MNLPSFLSATAIERQSFGRAVRTRELTGIYSPLSLTAAQEISHSCSTACLHQIVQLSLNSLGTTGFSFVPNARDGLYGDVEAGFAFSSIGSMPEMLGFLEVNGILNWGIVF